MVRIFKPQVLKSNLRVNTNTPPQGLETDGTGPPVDVLMIFNVTGETMSFNVTGEDMEYN